MTAPALAGRGRLLAVVAGAAVVVVVILLWVGVPSSQQRLDPQSDADEGTSALMALVTELGGDVTLDVTPADFAGGNSAGGADLDVLLMLRDQLDDAERADLSRWVRDGGVLVVADPRSAMAPLSDGPGTGDGAGGDLGPRDRSYADLFGPPTPVTAGTCTIGALDHPDLSTLVVPGQATRYPVASASRSCFGDGTSAFAVATDRGAGTVVSLGSAGILTNEALGDEDNAVAAAALVAPRSGTAVGVMDLSPQASAGDESLLSLVPTWVWQVLAQLGVAILVYVLWRARRLGQPVNEPQPVKVASSELVAAVGGLLERTGSPQHAADLLRTDLHRDLVARLGLAHGLPPDAFFQAVESRCDLDPAQLRLALGPGPVNDDRELIAVVDNIDAVRKEVL